MAPETAAELTHETLLRPASGPRRSAATIRADTESRSGTIRTGIRSVQRARHQPGRFTACTKDWHEAVESVADACLLVDATSRVLRHNGTAAELFLAGGASLVGRSFGELLHGGPSPPVDCPIVRASHSGRRERAEIQLGDRRLEVTVCPFMDAADGYSGSLCIVTDVTGRSEAPAPLLMAERKFRDVFESANVGKALTLPSGEFEINPAMARMLGFEPGERPPRTWR